MVDERRGCGLLRQPDGTLWHVDLLSSLGLCPTGAPTRNWQPNAGAQVRSVGDSRRGNREAGSRGQRKRNGGRQRNVLRRPGRPGAHVYSTDRASLHTTCGRCMSRVYSFESRARGASAAVPVAEPEMHEPVSVDQLRTP
eukprot:112466-Prymnesium_polylepis.2